MLKGLATRDYLGPSMYVCIVCLFNFLLKLCSHAVSNDIVLKMVPSFQAVQPMMGIYLLQYLNHW